MQAFTPPLNLSYRLMKRRCRGFNLIEMAIVLGVIGVIIGGIWTAASAVQRNLKINEVSSTALSIASCIQKIWPSIPAINQPVWSDYSRTMYLAGCFPAGYTIDTAAAVNTNPYGYVWGPNGRLWYLMLGYFNGIVVAPQIRITVNSSECSEVLFKTLNKIGSNLQYYAIENIAYVDQSTVDLQTLTNRCAVITMQIVLALKPS